VAVGSGSPSGYVWLAGTPELGSLFAPPESASFGLTRSQERTLDAFRSCATPGALIDQLHIDGSFTFQATMQADVYKIKDCMGRSGYRFDS
jgi:hypothetical protein